MSNHESVKSTNPYDKLKSLIHPELEEVNNLILSFVKSDVDLIPTITNHLTAAGGKRLRPILTIACAQLFEKTAEASIMLAAAVEFIHTATLLHDDVIDESNIRRNLSTANSIWGNKASILVGDYLLSQAFRLMVKAGNIDALSMLADSALFITESEVWQLDLINKVDLTIDNYIKLITGKTAVLFAAACAVSAIVQFQEKEIIDKLYNFGMNLGICFQIMDDILDYYPRDRKFGKKIGRDFYEGKITLPFVIAYKNATSADKEALTGLMLKNNKDEGTLKEIFTYFDKYNAFNESLKIASNFSIKGEGFITDWTQSVVGKSLVEVIRYSVDRQY